MPHQPNAAHLTDQHGLNEEAPPPASPYVLGLRERLARSALVPKGQFALGDLVVEVAADEAGVWALVRRAQSGGLAIRLLHAPGADLRCGPWRQEEEACWLDADSGMGRHRMRFTGADGDHPILRLSVWLTAATPLLIPFAPRDLVPLDNHDDPLGAKGNVEAGQRGFNAGLVYFHIDEPAFGNVLYIQNLTALNDYFNATQTKPDGAVGGVWPELGYLLPTPPQSDTPPTAPIPAGKETMVSDAIVVFQDCVPGDHHQSALHFLQMLGAAYPHIDRAAPALHDWAWRAAKTLADLRSSPKALTRHFDHLYAHPYTSVEYPDSMVQLSLLAAIRDYTRWRGAPSELEEDFLAGLEMFYDPKLGVLRRYLPDVGTDKNPDAVDSWYLYHPLMNLGRLALGGDDRARDLFMRTVKFGIKAARHFNYSWPVQYNITNFAVITPTAPADGRGQTDVGGLYAWVMLQAFELTSEERFLQEARAGLDACAGMRFNINYQANLTAWGAAACLRLARITGLGRYRDQAHLFLASFFHNTVLWESDVGGAGAYRVFLGVTCLQDAPYMAIYECFDSFTAFEYCLRETGAALDPAVRMLLSDYCKYALDRAWFYYPDALPKRMLATRSRNGHIDPDLSFPLEDLYVDGRAAGQVGQEIYGAGAAFVFASRMLHAIRGAPFRLFCDRFLRAIEQVGEREVRLTFLDGENGTACIALFAPGKDALPPVTLLSAQGEAIEPTHGMTYHPGATAPVTLRWEERAEPRP